MVIRYCYVDGCENSSIDFEIFNMPGAVMARTLRQKWLKALSWHEHNVVVRTRVCSAHFEKKDVIWTGRNGRLKSTAVPKLSLGLGNNLI